ncbi:uncharacterized protein LOC136036316 isoform X2 [Artemia franciscana]|uniref:63 kDa sperm flagellar membrane protein n=1 Tax=Artemia franciscana TaxID=6661 RepID=A0AA88HXY3_ARTSF|nr:hypothetical protein QYM36_004184 [Artemia franciscana]
MRNQFLVVILAISLLRDCSGVASVRSNGVFFPEYNQIDTGQKIARKGRTDFDDAEVGRKAERQGVGVQDIINNIVSLLGGNVNLHTTIDDQMHPPAAVPPQNRLPFHHRINNRGPPTQNVLPFEAIPLEPANVNKRPFNPNGIPLPVQIVPQRPGILPGPRPQGPVTIPLRPPVRVTPPPLPDLFAFAISNTERSKQEIPSTSSPMPVSTQAPSTSIEKEDDEEEVSLDEYYQLTDDQGEQSESSDQADNSNVVSIRDNAEALSESVENTKSSQDSESPLHTIKSEVDESTAEIEDKQNIFEVTNVEENSGTPNKETQDTKQVDNGYNDTVYEEIHYEYEDEPEPFTPVISPVMEVTSTIFSTITSSTLLPSIEEFSTSSLVTPTQLYSSVVTSLPDPETNIYPVPSNPVATVVNEPRPTPPLQVRPGMIFNDQREYYGSVGGAEYTPDMFWINKQQLEGDTFELTLNAAQNFGGGGSNGATQTFRIPALGRPVIEPIDIEQLRGEDGILTVGRPGDEFVSIDGKRTYFNLFPDTAHTVGPTPYPAPAPKPSSLLYQSPQPHKDQVIAGTSSSSAKDVPHLGTSLPAAVPGTIASVPRPGTAVSVPRPLPSTTPQETSVPGPNRVAPSASAPTTVKEKGIGTFEIEESPIKKPVSFTSSQSPSGDESPLRIDTCLEGDDSTCEVGETCNTDKYGASCVCRTGWGRKNLRLGCVELINLALSLKVDRFSGRPLTFKKDYADPLSSGYKELKDETKLAIDSLLARSLLPLYMDSKVMGFMEYKDRMAANITVSFEASPITSSPSFRSELQRQITNTIEGFSNRLGSSQLFVEGSQSPVIAIDDIDECQIGLHDCPHNANCRNKIGSFYCACKIGFVDKKDLDQRMTGRFCVPATCSNDYCNKRGECRMEGARKVCLCRGSFGGAQCDIDKEVVGVAAGASATAILIIILTLVGLCWWSKKWRRDQDSEFGMPHYAAKIPGHMALALPYAPQFARPPPIPPQPYYMPAFIHPPIDYELSSMHSQEILSQISTLRRSVAPTLSLPPQLESRRKTEEEGLVGAVRMWYRRLSKRKHPGSSNVSTIGIPIYSTPYMEQPVSRPKRTGSVISHGKSRRAPPPPSQPPPPLIEFTEDRASLSSGLYDSIDDKRSLNT